MLINNKIKKAMITKESNTKDLRGLKQLCEIIALQQFKTENC